MKPFPKIVWIVPAVALGLGLLMIGLNKLFDARAGYAFAHVQMGDAESRVIMYMGAPNGHESCGALLWWNNQVTGKNDGRCVSQVRYAYPHSTWIIGYSADKRVVSKHHEKN